MRRAEPEAEPDRDVHAWVDLKENGRWELWEYGDEEVRRRELFVKGTKVHHVSEDAAGVWRYRGGWC